MVEAPLAIESLNKITKGKASLQNDLLDVFFNNALECVQAMENTLMRKEGSNSAWYASSQELKLLSRYMGAPHLARLCESAKFLMKGELDKRKSSIQLIRAEIQKIRSYVRNTSH